MFLHFSLPLCFWNINDHILLLAGYKGVNDLCIYFNSTNMSKTPPLEEEERIIFCILGESAAHHEIKNQVLGVSHYQCSICD